MPAVLSPHTCGTRQTHHMMGTGECGGLTRAPPNAKNPPSSTADTAVGEGGFFALGGARAEACVVWHANEMGGMRACHTAHLHHPGTTTLPPPSPPAPPPSQHRCKALPFPSLHTHPHPHPHPAAPHTTPPPPTWLSLHIYSPPPTTTTHLQPSPHPLTHSPTSTRTRTRTNTPSLPSPPTSPP